MSSCTVRSVVPPKSPDHPDVKRAVLDAAIAIIAADGPDALSMREVARRADISHQAPYHHFADRAGILAAISEEGYRAFADEVRAAAGERLAAAPFDSERKRMSTVHRTAGGLVLLVKGAPESVLGRSLRAARDGIIRKTGRLIPSRNARRHRDLTEWTGR